MARAFCVSERKITRTADGALRMGSDMVYCKIPVHKRNTDAERYLDREKGRQTVCQPDH